MKLVHEGNPSAIIFALKTRFKNRGYGFKETPQEKAKVVFNLDFGKPDE